MLRFLGQLEGRPVFAQQLGEAIGTIDGWLIDPDKGRLVAYQVRQGRQRRWLSIVDILAYTDDAVVIADPAVLQEAEALIRLKALLAQSFRLIGTRVVSERGRRLGRVREVLLETNGHNVAKLHVKPSWLGRLWRDELIIPRERIVRMAPQRVVVRYDEKAPAAAIEPEIAQ